MSGCFPRRVGFVALRQICLQANGLPHTSPGQRPGNNAVFPIAVQRPASLRSAPVGEPFNHAITNTGYAPITKPSHPSHCLQYSGAPPLASLRDPTTHGRLFGHRPQRRMNPPFGPFYYPIMPLTSRPLRLTRKVDHDRIGNRFGLRFVL